MLNKKIKKRRLSLRFFILIRIIAESYDLFFFTP